MPDINITQAEADALFDMEKVPADDQIWNFPTMGMKIEIPLVSKDNREKFFLDVNRGKIDLKKITYQNRSRQVIVLARIDISGPPHRNPDDSEVQPPHIHRYKEGYGDKWAYPIPVGIFSDLDDHWQTLIDFMEYCNIIEYPDIKKVMF